MSDGPGTSPVPTHGMSHVALAVTDPARSLRFYQAVFGVVPIFQRDDFIQAQTPGSRDVLVFERRHDEAGKRGGIAHFGFRLRRPEDIERALSAVRLLLGSRRVRGRDMVRGPHRGRSGGLSALARSAAASTLG